MELILIVCHTYEAFIITFFFSIDILNANAALIKTYETVESVVYASDDNLIVQKDDDLEEMIGVEEDEETAQYPLQQVIEEVVLEDQIQYIISWIYSFRLKMRTH